MRRTRQPGRGASVGALAVPVLGAILAAPTWALACPSCAARPTPGTAVFTAVALMIAVPYVIAVITIRTIRRLERDS